MSLVLYDPPKPDILQFLSLEPLQLSPSPESQSGISISDSSSSSSSKTEFKHEEMTPLQSKLEKSIALDPERWFEVTGGYREFGPGSGLRKAVELVSKTKDPACISIISDVNSVFPSIHPPSDQRDDSVDAKITEFQASKAIFQSGQTGSKTFFSTSFNTLFT